MISKEGWSSLRGSFTMNCAECGLSHGSLKRDGCLGCGLSSGLSLNVYCAFLFHFLTSEPILKLKERLHTHVTLEVNAVKVSFGLFSLLATAWLIFNFLINSDCLLWGEKHSIFRAWLIFNFLFNSDCLLWGEKHRIFSFKWKPFKTFRVFKLKWDPGYTKAF